MRGRKETKNEGRNLYVTLSPEAMTELREFMYDTTGDARVRSSVIERYIKEGVARDKATGRDPLESNMSRLKAIASEADKTLKDAALGRAKRLAIV